MVIQGLNEGEVYFSGNLNDVVITGINEYVDLSLSVAGIYIMDHERFYPVAGKVVLSDFDKLIGSYFTSADFSALNDFYIGDVRNIYIY